MPEVLPFPDGGYRYLKGPFQFSGGVAAEPGFAIERAQFHRPVPLDEGFRAIERHIESLSRPLAALCACELRSPAPFTESGFTDFNRLYVGTLERWGIYRDGANPVARSNICPEIAPPAAPSLHAFSYTMPAPSGTRPSFVIAGVADAAEGKGSYRDRTIRLGDTSAEGLREKARHVLGELERRMQAFGCGWADATAVQAYTVFDLHPVLADDIARRCAISGGLTWHYARPPVECFDYEMDVRGVAREIIL
jgi:hypothetical protein